MKVREIITIKGWINGSGWSYTTCYGDDIVEISVDTREEIKDTDVEWDWWEVDDKPNEDGDTLIVVRYFDVDADPDEDAPLGEWSVWENELINERTGI